MEGVITDKLGEKEFKDAEEDIDFVVEAAMDKLASMNVEGFKYAVDFAVMPDDSAYRRNTSFWWAKETDKCLKVNVQNKNVGGYLVVYAMKQ